MKDIYVTTNEAAKQFIRNLQSVRYYNLKIMSINSKLEEIETELGIHAIDTSKEPSSTPVSNYRLIELIEEESALIIEKNEYVKNIEDVEKYFELIPGNVQNIMIDLYLLRINHYKIAKKYNYTRQNIYKLVNNSIKKVLNL